VIQPILALARREGVDAIIIAGNLLADNRVGEETIGELTESLKASTVPVYILPGCLDPITPDSPYLKWHRLFSGPLEVLRKAEAVEIDGKGTLYPCPVSTRTPRHDPTSWILTRESPLPRIGIVNTGPDRSHGSGLRLPSDCARERGLDCVLAGGKTCRTEKEQVFYSGSPEPLDFDDCQGEVTVMEWSGGQRQSTFKRVASTRWVEATEEVRDIAELASLSDRLAVQDDRLNTLLRLTLVGRLGLESLPVLKNLEDTLRASYRHLEFRDQVSLDLEKMPSFQNPLIKRVTENLAETACRESVHDPQVPDEPEIARAALTRLLTLLLDPHCEDLNSWK
jgi:DNA repair exonuclease SbcCD nuclease subunit